MQVLGSFKYIGITACGVVKNNVHKLNCYKFLQIMAAWSSGFVSFKYRLHAQNYIGITACGVVKNNVHQFIS